MMKAERYPKYTERPQKLAAQRAWGAFQDLFIEANTNLTPSDLQFIPRGKNSHWKCTSSGGVVFKMTPREVNGEY